MQYKYLLFDADGTLYNFEKTEENAIKWTWEQYNIPQNEETVGCFMRNNSKAWSMIEQGTLTVERLKTIRFEWVFSELKLDIDPKKFAQSFMDNLGKTGELLPNSLEVLKELKRRGYTIYILTNGIYQVQSKRFTLPEVDGIFDRIFCSEKMGVSKPKKEFYDIVFSELGFSEEQRKQSIMIGDSLSSDIQGGINAGLDTIWFNPNKLPQKPNIKPTHEINDIRQVLDFFPPLQ